MKLLISLAFAIVMAGSVYAVVMIADASQANKESARSQAAPSFIAYSVREAERRLRDRPERQSACSADVGGGCQLGLRLLKRYTQLALALFYKLFLIPHPPLHQKTGV